MKKSIYLAALLLLCACQGLQSGRQVGWGIDALDTQGAQDKANEAWFDSFYSNKHCGVSEGQCPPGATGWDTGGFWGSGYGPDHSGATVGGTDSSGSN